LINFPSKIIIISEQQESVNPFVQKAPIFLSAHSPFLIAGFNSQANKMPIMEIPVPTQREGDESILNDTNLTIPIQWERV